MRKTPLILALLAPISAHAVTIEQCSAVPEVANEEILKWPRARLVERQNLLESCQKLQMGKANDRAQAAVQSAKDSEVLTVAGGVVCQSPFKLSEGIKAANAGDDKWTAEAGCVRLRENVRAIRLNPLEGIGNPWQVRLIMEDGNGITAWGYAPSFKSKSGKKFWPGN